MRPLLTAALTATALGSLLAGAAEAATKRGPSLAAFRSCSALVDEARDAAQEPPIPFRGPWSWNGTDTLTPRSPYDQPDPNRPVAIALPSAAPVSELDAAGGAGDDVTSSSTNVQEAGIDEPDLVKAVGGRLYVIAGSTLWVLDATGDTPRVLGKLALEGNATGSTLLIEGDRALVLTPRQPAYPQIDGVALAARVPAPAPGAATPTRLTELDLADPAQPRLLRSMEVPGDLVTARLTDGTARIVLNSAAGLGGGAAGVAGGSVPSEGITARAARRLSLRSFVPSTVLRSRVTGRTYTRRLVRCVEVRHPEEPAGTDLLTVLTVDLRKGLFNVDRDAVLGSAQLVYASPTGLYVASTDDAAARTPSDVPRRPTTQLYRFDTTVRDATTFASSGTVRGYALNQYSLGESRGVLRIAMTETPGWIDPGKEESESYVTTLRERGRTLEQVGQLGGLGKTERIYAARFIGDAGYLVTFRQTDPLYTLDLSDPAQPRVAGELKITGYSAYLHPVGDGLLLGIGRDATAQGQVIGAAVSLFDVADPASPKLVARRALDAGGSSAAEFDPHAFLWWAPTKLALVPSQGVGDWRTSANGSVGSVYGLRAARDAPLTEVGRVLHGPDWDHPLVKRTVIVGGRALSLSDLGIRASKLEDLSAQGWLPWVG